MRRWDTHWRTHLAAAVLVGTTLLSGCAGPTLTEEHYRSQAARSAGSAVSELETIRLAVVALLQDRVWRQYVDVVVTEAETALSPDSPPTSTTCCGSLACCSRSG